MHKKKTLPNGLRVVAVPMNTRQSVALGLWIRVGGRYESDEFKGISHFLEHLLFKGSKKHSCRQIKESIEGIGGTLNGFTAEEMTCYFVKIPAFHLDAALDILSDMVINPLLQQEDIEKERTVILEEIKMYRDLPQSYVYDLLDELLWPRQPLGMSIIGSAESVGKIKRQHVHLYKQQYYVPQNIVVSVCGRVKYERFTQQVGKIFGGLKNTSIGAFLRVKEEQESPQLKLFNKDTEQTHLALGFHSFHRDHPLRHALGMLHVALGANMSSRLFNEVRERRGLAYEIGTQVKRFHDTGAFIVHAGIDNSKVTEAVSVILRELKKISEKQISVDEFRRAKEFYIGQLVLALEDTLDQMLWVGESTVALNRTYTLEEIIRQVKRLTREDIRSVAQQLFKEENLNLAIIGPLKDSEDALYKRLSFD